MAVMVKCFSVTLSNIIQRNFPEEYAERKSEHETMTYAGIDLMPLFVMDVVLPCQKMALNIFEPRYRLMVPLLPLLVMVFSDSFLKHDFYFSKRYEHTCTCFVNKVPFLYDVYIKGQPGARSSCLHNV
jgi:hypothetical protein